MRLTAPGQIEGYEPIVDVGMVKYDFQDIWHGYNCDKSIFENNETAAFNEITAILA
jgi:hypothetical protein